ncbi:MAG: GGDEF domain-containing protein [Phycisphaeraceae bacterium]|nr:GGDEF domain-containing protein [Phycisphaeraceae bacterium]
MNQDLLEQVLACPTLPTLPAVAVQVLELMQRPNVSTEDLSAVIQNDQGLSAKILKTANSSFYGVRRPCATINQAVVMLGLATVKSLALSFSLVTAVDGEPSGEFDFPAYWRRGLYTAVAAKCIAHEAGLAAEDEAFLGGLLQDIGMVGMFRGLGRKYLEVLLATDGDHRALVRHELSELELQHPDVGAMMCERWKLPPELIMPVRYHERPTAAPESHAELVRCVGLGNIAHDVLTDADAGQALRLFQSKAAQWFEFDAETCNTLIHRIADGARQVSSLFRLSIGAQADAETILARARAHLDALQARAAPEEPADARLNALVSDSDEHDALTGILSPRIVSSRIDEAFALAETAGKSLTLAFVSFDDFPSLTLRAGQDSVDALLVEAAAFLADLVESMGGQVGRWDETTFCLVLPGIDRAEAARTAGEIRAAIPAQCPRWGLSRLSQHRLTVSVGAATFSPSESVFTRPPQLISAALRARDAATSGGGNCIRTFIPKRAA